LDVRIGEVMHAVGAQAPREREQGLLVGLLLGALLRLTWAWAADDSLARLLSGAELRRPGLGGADREPDSRVAGAGGHLRVGEVRHSVAAHAARVRVGGGRDVLRVVLLLAACQDDHQAHEVKICTNRNFLSCDQHGWQLARHLEIAMVASSSLKFLGVLHVLRNEVRH